jgi:hypothetical protein
MHLLRISMAKLFGLTAKPLLSVDSNDLKVSATSLAGHGGHGSGSFKKLLSTLM